MLASISKHISSKTIFSLVTAKLLFWSIGMIVFDAGFYFANLAFEIGDYALTKYLMLFAALLGLFNLIKWHNKHLFIILSHAYCFLWVYVLVGYALTSGSKSSLVFRNIPEILFIIFMMFGVYHDPELYGKKTLRDTGSDDKEQQTNPN